MKKSLANILKGFFGLNERRTVYRGIIRGFLNLSPGLTAIRIDDIYDTKKKEKNILFFHDFNEDEFIDKDVDIVITESGFLKSRLKQGIYAYNRFYEISLTKKQIREIKRSCPPYMISSTDNFCFN